MIPDAAETVRRRVSAALAIRLICVPFIFISLIPIGLWIGETVDDGGFRRFDRYISQVIFGLLGLVVTGGTMFVAGWVARFIVKPARYNRCPGCGYRLEALVEPMCSECGLPLTPEFMGKENQNRVGEPVEVYRAKMITVFTPIVRIAASVSAFACAMISGAIVLVMAFSNDWDPEPTAVACVFIMGGVTSAAVVIAGGLLTRMMVPKIRSSSGLAIPLAKSQAEDSE